MGLDLYLLWRDPSRWIARRAYHSQGSKVAFGDPEASCARCEAITHAFEGRALSSVFLHPRLHSNMKRTEPERIPITLTKTGMDDKEAVRPEDYHVFGHFPVFLPARTILGYRPSQLDGPSSGLP